MAKSRLSRLGPHDIFLLDQWGRQLSEAFGQRPYLVGSALGSADYRDVDVRMLDPLRLGNRPLARRAINLALTLWGRTATGLPIDFQLQTRREFHAHDGKPRNPLGTRSLSQWKGIGFG